MTTQEYKEFKNIRKESLRDNMSDIEVMLTDIGEITTRELVKEFNPNGLKENIIIAKSGGEIAGITRKEIESKIGKSIVSNKNNLNYEYIGEYTKIE